MKGDSMLRRNQPVNTWVIAYGEVAGYGLKYIFKIIY